jgi:hypothetical protein
MSDDNYFAAKESLQKNKTLKFLQNNNHRLSEGPQLFF